MYCSSKLYVLSIWDLRPAISIIITITIIITISIAITISIGRALRNAEARNVRSEGDRAPKSVRKNDESDDNKLIMSIVDGWEYVESPQHKMHLWSP